MAFADTLSSIVVQGGTALIVGGFILAFLIVSVVISIALYKRKKWNIKLTIKLPRSDGRLILTDNNAKGFWDSENGWIMVKRKGYKPVPSRPIDPKKWLQGLDHATLIQVGPQDYIVANELSYQILTDPDTGEEMALMKVVADLGKRKTWKNYTERMGKKTFTLAGWMEKYQFYIAMGVLLFCMFLGFAILWNRMPSLCGAV